MDQVPGRVWDETPLVEATVGAEESVAAVVSRSVASVAGVPDERLPPLYEAVDPDALERLFADGAEGYVAFRYNGLWVVVTASGTVEVREP